MLPESQIREILVDRPDLIDTVLEAQQLPSKPWEYRPDMLAILFEGVLVAAYKQKKKLFSLTLPADFKPEVIEIYGDEELLLVKASGEMLVNRLPDNVGWTTYAAQ